MIRLILRIAETAECLLAPSEFLKILNYLKIETRSASVLCAQTRPAQLLI